MSSEEKIQNDKRAHILDVAEYLFAHQGFEAVSIREISKAADINIAMVSYYFGSKEKLYEAVVTRKLISSELILHHIERYNCSKDKLFVIVDLLTDKFFEHRNMQTIIFREMAMEQRTAMAELIANQLHQNFTIINDVIQKGIKQKEFKKVDVELTVMTIIGIVKIYTTSSPVVCKVLKTEDKELMFSKQYKLRLKKYLKELLMNHLGIK